jgi:FAD-linked sulfhydryl oxidase
MAEAPHEPIDSQYKGTGNIFNQKSTASAGSSKQPRDDDRKAPLPKGVVLDKDGKP